MANTIYKMHWTQIVITLFCSIVLALAATIFLSVYWPAAEPTERMAVGALSSVLIWLFAVLIGFLAKNSWRTGLWLGGSSLALIAINVITFNNQA